MGRPARGSRPVTCGRQKEWDDLHNVNLSDLFDIVVNRGYVNSTHVGSHSLTINLPLALHQTAVDPRLVVGARRNQPTILRAFPFHQLPAKYFAIELDGSFWIVGMDFELNDTRHFSHTFRN
jgi:hypothetical protein